MMWGFWRQLTLRRSPKLRIQERKNARLCHFLIDRHLTLKSRIWVSLLSGVPQQDSKAWVGKGPRDEPLWRTFQGTVSAFLYTNNYL